MAKAVGNLVPLEKGIEVRGNSMRFVFQFEGKKVAEQLTIDGRNLHPLVNADRNIANATVIKARRLLAANIFEFKEVFPDSKRAKDEQEVAQKHSFCHVADLWYRWKQGEVEESSLYAYRCSMNFWKEQFGNDKPIDEIDRKELSAMLGDIWAKYGWSEKHFNNRIGVLRNIMEFHFLDRENLNPMRQIKGKSVPKSKADPLRTEERDMMLDYMRSNFDERVYAYFLFAFFTGMRPEEIIALVWSDVNWVERTIKVQRRRTFRGTAKKGTKTGRYQSRTVDLLDEAIEALKIMRKYTYVLTESDVASNDIFQNPKTGRPWADEQMQRDKFWKPALKALEMRDIRCYNTRHTFATMLLRNGVPEALIKEQMGHEHDSQMLSQHYTTWDRDTAEHRMHWEKLKARLAENKLSTGNFKEIPQMNPHEFAASI